MSNNNDWLLKKSFRSIDNLRLWGANPRLDPENNYTTTKEFAEEITNSDSDRSSFLDIVKSIVSRGFIPADPIVVWQDEENQKFYVAEGNRRVLALKLLRYPAKAPKSIKGIITKLSSSINIDDYKKVPVSIAPTFEDAEWYVSQRHSTSSLQKRWSSEQQKRWISDLFEKYNGDIDIIKRKIEITESELQGIIRTLKIKSYVREIKSELTESEFSQANSHTFPITTLDRFFKSTSVREEWGIEFKGYDVEIANKKSFLNAFTSLIKRMILPIGDKQRIDSRIIRTANDTQDILKTLPTVDKTIINSNIEIPNTTSSTETQNIKTEEDNTGGNQSNVITEAERRNNLKNNPNRTRIVSDFYFIETDSHKLSSLFEELKLIPIKYQNAVAASIRIFLDLSVLKYIETENLESEIRAQFNSSLREIILKKRLEFLKGKISDSNVTKIIGRLLNSNNEYSLDVLNGYVHSNDTHYLSLTFLNGFWDALFPLLQKLVVIKEN